MFKVLYNQARIVYRLEPVTGLLIKSGRESFDPTRPDMEFIRTWAEVEEDDQIVTKEVPFLPGSSIKGVVRSHAEQILRTLDKWTCDITQKSCTKDDENKSPHYRKHCYTCRTFGNTTMAAHMRFTDVFPWEPPNGVYHPSLRLRNRRESLDRIRIANRPGIAIDRRKGTTAKGAFFEAEVITSGVFWGEIFLRNYQLWQLALLAFAFRDINEGYQRVGALKSRGLGRVKISVEDLYLEQYGLLAAPNGGKIRGIGAIETLITDYHLIGKDEVLKPEQLSWQSELLCQKLNAQKESADDIWRQLTESIVKSNHWVSFIEEGSRLKGEQPG